MSHTALPSDEERTLLRDSVRGFLDTHWPAAGAVERAREPAEVRRIWRQLAAQGLATLPIDPSEGGLREVLIVMEELGRAACPAPALDAALANVALWPLREREPAIARSLDALHSGEAGVAIAFAGADPDATAGSVTIRDGRLSGVARYLEAAASATHFIVAVSPGPALAIVEASAAGIEIVATRALGADGLCSVKFANVPAVPIEVPAATIDEAIAISRLLHAARAHGAARRAFELAVDYVKQRKQFGQPVGRFQALQHKLATNQIALEAVRLSLANAAAHRDHGAPSWRFFAAGACAFANEALRRVALETQHAFGAIGYAEEHEAPRHFKRVHLDVVRHRAGRRDREALAEHLLGTEPHALPALDLGPAANAFRKEVRAWLERHWTDGQRAAHHRDPLKHRERDPAFARELGRTGWLGATWPKRHGGQERSTLEQLALMEEMERAEAPRAGAPIQSVSWMRFGTPEQQQRYLPEILRGEVLYGIWYSEPDSGSDLASLRTTAVRDGDDWVINGQKIWTTSYYGDYMWLAARTDPTAKPAHAGLTLFVVRTDTPGITIRPMKTMYDGEFVNTFLDNVRVPADAVVGGVGNGWQVLTGSLGTERSVVGGGIALKVAHTFDLLCAWIRAAEVDGRPLRLDPIVRDTIGSFAAQIEAGRQIALNCASMAVDGESPLVDAAISKVYCGELMERFHEAALDILGMQATLSGGSDGAILHGTLEQKLRHSLMWVISLGTNEIQRSLIAQRGLGLPR